MPERNHMSNEDTHTGIILPKKKRKRQHLAANLSANNDTFKETNRQGRARQLDKASCNASTKTSHNLGSSDSSMLANKVSLEKRKQLSKISGLEKSHGNLREKANSLWGLRKSLPIWSHSEEIRKGLREKDVMLLVGETGSGKSTQVPQMLVKEQWCKSQSVTIKSESDMTHNVTVGGCIAITEPRRVAAISLARRVAEEMGTPLGSSSPASKVGYSVRFDNSTSPSIQIKFLTEGMLLQEILRDPWLRQYSAVIVDEVHERGVNVDLVLGFLRTMVAGEKEGRGGIPLKVAVMSATADMERLLTFFDEGHNLQELECSIHHGNAQGETKKENAWYEDDSEWCGISDKMETNNKNFRAYSNHNQQDGENLKNVESIENAQAPFPTGGKPKRDTSHCVATCHIEGRQYPVKIVYSPEPVQDFVDASLRAIFQIHYKEPMPGDVLVFLTGQETVESLENLVNEYALSMGSDVPKLLILPLFAAMPQVAQQRVFQPAPPKTRKVILATNIAETSVTVTGVRFVIDCGKAKIKQYRSRIGLDSLLVKPISKSAAIQRKGRAGREAPGQCYRLYTEKDYHLLEESNTPEILRCDLSQAILAMKARGVVDIAAFPFLDPPPRESLEKALLQLFQLQALQESGQISEVGLQMAKLPLSVSLARVLLAAEDPEMDCVSQAIDIISCLSVENIFLNLTSEEKKEEAKTVRRELYRREGDHLTLLATVQAYAAEHINRKAWAERHFVSHRAMQSVMDIRKQLRAQRQNSLSSSPEPSLTTLTTETAARILKCFLRGFATNTARLFPDGSYKTLIGNQTVAIHPSSGLFGKKVEAIMYNEFVFTNRSYARGVSAVQMDWIGEVLEV